MKTYFYGLLLTATCIFHVECEYKLQMVNIVFRHGDRTPDKCLNEMYPSDPNINNTFYPTGYGGLTKEGKFRAYTLGTTLRNEYKNFLNSTYFHEDIAARSTDFDRTKMTLELVLAGLYPPDESQRWHPTLQWQPIPTKYEKNSEDSLLMPTGCPRFKAMEAEIRKLPEFVNRSAEFQELYTKLTELSGQKITHCKTVLRFYNTLMEERSMNLTIPKWAEELLENHELDKAVALQIELKNYNTTLKKLNGGVLLKKMRDDMIKRTRGELESGKNIRLYSAHDINVAAHLLALGVAEPHQPYFTSAVILELYLGANNKYYVQVLYYQGDTGKITRKKIPCCDYLCEFEEFQKSIQQVIPSDDEICTDVISRSEKTCSCD